MWIDTPKAPVITPPAQFLMPIAEQQVFKKFIAWWDNTPDLVKNMEGMLDKEFNENMYSVALQLFFDNCTNVDVAKGNDDPPYFVGYFEVVNDKLFAVVSYAEKVDVDKVEIVGK